MRGGGGGGWGLGLGIFQECKEKPEKSIKLSLNLKVAVHFLTNFVLCEKEQSHTHSLKQTLYLAKNYNHEWQ